MLVFPRPVLTERIVEARRMMAAAGCAGLLLGSASRAHNAGQSAGNTAHFLGYTPMVGTVLLLLTPDGRPVVLAAGQNEKRMLAARVGDIGDIVSAGDVGATVAALLAARGISAEARIGLAGRTDLAGRVLMSLDAHLPGLADLDTEVHRVRAAVVPADLERHAAAARISDLMLARAFALAAKPGMTPARLMAGVEHEGRRQGAEIARLWLATGANPPVTSFEFFELEEAIRPGDRVQLGTTVCVEGHFCQGLRMGVRGAPSQELIAATETLLAIQDEVLGLMAPGRKAHEVADRLEALIDAACPYRREEDPFRFQSCHQLGLDYSDPALATALNVSRDRSGDAAGPVLRVGQVIEVHPNYNLPGLGHVCMGDAAVVTATGAEWLTRAPRELRVIG